MINKMISIILFALAILTNAQNNKIEEQRINLFIQNIRTNINLNTYLVYNIDKKYLVINKINKGYEYYFYDEFFDYKKQKKNYNLITQEKKGKEKILDNFFEDKCKFCNSTNYPIGSSYIYFVKYKNNMKTCEFIIPYITYSKQKKYCYPIKNKYIKFFTETILIG